MERQGARGARAIVVRVLIPFSLSDRDLDVVAAIATEVQAAVTREDAGLVLECRSADDAVFAIGRLGADLNCESVAAVENGRSRIACARDALERARTRIARGGVER